MVRVFVDGLLPAGVMHDLYHDATRESRTELLSESASEVAVSCLVSAWLAQLVNAPTQMHVQSCTVEVQLHSRADSLTQASILPRSVK